VPDVDNEHEDHDHWGLDSDDDNDNELPPPIPPYAIIINNTSNYPDLTPLITLIEAGFNNLNNAMLALAQAIQNMGDTIMADLSNITAAVQATTDVEQSAILLLNNLSAQLTAAATDPAAVQALADQLTAKSGELAAAITANTPAAPAAG
jgi:hypothetical protein